MNEVRVPGTTYRRVAGEWWAYDEEGKLRRFKIGLATTRYLLDAIVDAQLRLDEAEALREAEAGALNALLDRQRQVYEELAGGPQLYAARDGMRCLACNQLVPGAQYARRGPPLADDRGES